MTVKLFQENPYLQSHTAEVLEVNGNVVICDSTIFAPSAGGQKCDFGWINDIKVIDVTEEGEKIAHHLEKEVNKNSFGNMAEMKLDWERRFDHMQNHCGEHILSGVFFRHFEASNKGFHLGEEYATLDLDVKDISEEQLTEAEYLANRAIYQNIPVHVKKIENQEEAQKLPLRKPLQVEEDILIVTIDGVDCVACCCPHPSTTGEVAIIKIIRTEKYKGMTRITFLCGHRAFSDYSQKHKVTAVLNEKFSADNFTLLEKMTIQDKKNDELRRELHMYKQKFAEIEALELLKKSDKIVKKEYKNESLDELRRIAKKTMEHTDLPVVLSTLNQFTVLIVHSGKSKLNSGQIVKEFAVGAGGKGGGSSTQAQALFTDADRMRNFINIVEAHAK